MHARTTRCSCHRCDVRRVIVLNVPSARPGSADYACDSQQSCQCLATTSTVNHSCQSLTPRQQHTASLVSPSCKGAGLFRDVVGVRGAGCRARRELRLRPIYGAARRRTSQRPPGHDLAAGPGMAVTEKDHSTPDRGTIYIQVECSCIHIVVFHPFDVRRVDFLNDPPHRPTRSASSSAWRTGTMSA